MFSTVRTSTVKESIVKEVKEVGMIGNTSAGGT